MPFLLQFSPLIERFLCPSSPSTLPRRSGCRTSLLRAASAFSSRQHVQAAARDERQNVLWDSLALPLLRHRGFVRAHEVRHDYRQALQVQHYATTPLTIGKLRRVRVAGHISGCYLRTLSGLWRKTPTTYTRLRKRSM